MVLCIPDTTELDFYGQEARRLGPLRYGAQHSMVAHPAYTKSTSREPLGLLDAWRWARELNDKDDEHSGVKERMRRPES